jgi:succinate dehydrogenase/fumarate reductase flavoprotein subunit
MTKSRSCDVLIIGGGSAGLRAAIEAHDAGAQVLIISKSKRRDARIFSIKYAIF